MKAIIFGSSGQDGFYLTKLLESKGYAVIGISRSQPEQFVNIADFAAVEALIINTKPDFVFHLAANSSTKHHHVFENFNTIVTGTLNILEAVYRHSKQTKVFLSGSGLQFVNTGYPINEKDSLEPGSAYAMQRNQSLYCARYYRKQGVKVYFGFFFTHDSPLREARHVSQTIASAVKRIARGSEETIEIGDPSVRKEWGFAGDIVNGIWTLVNQEFISECVIGTGKAYSIKDWLEVCFNLISKDWRQHVVENKSFVAEYGILVSDPATLLAMGWKPNVDFAQLAKMMVSDAEK